MIRIGILARGFEDWAGGVDFLYSVVDSIRATGDRVELDLLFVEPRPRNTLNRWWQRARTAWGPPSGVVSEIAPPPACIEVARLCSASYRVAGGRGGMNTAIEIGRAHV